MAAKAGWLETIPEILQELQAIEDAHADEGDCLIERKQFESLMGIKARRAQDLMGAIGGIQVGKSLKVRSEDLRRYLETAGGAGLAEAEKKRRIALAHSLKRLQDEQQKTPRWLVDTEPIKEQQIAVSREGFDSLPPEIRLEPGRLMILFVDEQDLEFKLVLFAVAAKKDQRGMLERMGVLV